MIVFAVGALCILLGILICKGKINLLHDYHRDKIRPADQSVFCRLVGIGMFLVGGGILAFGGMLTAYLLAGVRLLLWLGVTLLAVGLAGGISLMTYAIRKYNKTTSI